MKILHTIGSLSKGGAEKQCRLLMDQHAKLGHEIGVIYFYDNHDISKNSKINYFQIKRGSRFNLIKFSYQIKMIIKEFNPDVVHNWLPEIITIPASIISKYYNIPSISSQRRVLQRNADFFDRIRDYFILVNHLISDKVICNFDFSFENKSTKKIIKHKKGAVIYNGFILNGPKKKEGFDFLNDNAIKLLFVGRLVAQKNIDILLKSVFRLKDKGHDVQLVIFGEGKLEEELKKQSIKLGLNNSEVIFAGYVSNWHDYVCNFDLFVFPTNAEGMPNVLIEAMNLGIATIASSIPEISGIFNHSEHVHLVKNVNSSSLAEAIEYVYSDSEYKNQLIENAHEKIKKFTVESMANSFLECYKLLSNKV